MFEQVLDLSEEKLEELDVLLRRTPLTAVITAAKKVADRLEFVKGLELLLFKPESTATLLERSQLHRILAGETWIFGEEFNLMGDDSSLTTVLKAHLSELGREELAVNEPVRDELGKNPCRRSRPGPRSPTQPESAEASRCGVETTERDSRS